MSLKAKKRREIVQTIEWIVYAIAFLVAGCAVSAVTGTIMMF